MSDYYHDVVIPGFWRDAQAEQERAERRDDRRLDALLQKEAEDREADTRSDKSPIKPPTP